KARNLLWLWAVSGAQRWMHKAASTLRNQFAGEPAFTKSARSEREAERGSARRLPKSEPHHVQLYVMGPAWRTTTRGPLRFVRQLTTTYWQASQSGSSMAHAFGTGAGPADISGAGAAFAGAPLKPSPLPLDTALSLPVLTVDFSVLVAARARRWSAVFASR